MRQLADACLLVQSPSHTIAPHDQPLPILRLCLAGTRQRVGHAPTIGAWQHALGNQAIQRLLTVPGADTHIQRTVWGWQDGQWKPVVPTTNQTPPPFIGVDGDFWDNETGRHLSRQEAIARYVDTLQGQIGEGPGDSATEDTEMETEPERAPSTAQTGVAVLGPAVVTSVPFAPRINSYFWGHIEGVHVNSGQAGKSEWASQDRARIKSWIDTVFEANKHYLKAPQAKGKPVRLWGQVDSVCGRVGDTGQPTRGVIVWVKVERADGRCKIGNAYPGEYS